MSVFTPARARIAAGAVLMAASAVVGQRVLASDHQDTPEVELNPRMDINDVFAFPGSGADRIALAMTTSSPIQGTSASFDNNLLYQFRIDNSGDAIEDRVIQVTFSGSGANQTVTVRGPIAPGMTGMRSTLVDDPQAISGLVGQTLGSASGVQVFTGLRDDPFFIDLEQFFKIVPDRRPSTGPLSQPQTQTATSFRSPGIDFLRTYNALAIVVEVPKSMLTSATGADANIGIWGTVSR
jgi:uncharacterized protein DUF4331